MTEPSLFMKKKMAITPAVFLTNRGQGGKIVLSGTRGKALFSVEDSGLGAQVRWRHSKLWEFPVEIATWLCKPLLVKASLSGLLLMDI